MYVLQITRVIIAQRSSDELPLVLGVLDAEIDRFMKAHAVAMQ
jgi:hypothetical protein